MDIYILRPCGVGISSLVALAGGWVNKTSLSIGTESITCSDLHCWGQTINVWMVQDLLCEMMALTRTQLR